MPTHPCVTRFPVGQYTDILKIKGTTGIIKAPMLSKDTLYLFLYVEVITCWMAGSIPAKSYTVSNQLKKCDFKLQDVDRWCYKYLLPSVRAFKLFITWPNSFLTQDGWKIDSGCPLSAVHSFLHYWWCRMTQIQFRIQQSLSLYKGYPGSRSTKTVRLNLVFPRVVWVCRYRFVHPFWWFCWTRPDPGSTAWHLFSCYYMLFHYYFY